MNEFIEKHKEIWGDDPRSLLDKYEYQPDLTRKLDEIDPAKLNRELFYEIVLWKLNRFPYITDELIEELRDVATLKAGAHWKAKELLEKLLRTAGIALPMASTILRFLNPKVFQIIDDRAYRVLLPGKEKYPTKPIKITEKYLDNSIKIYFEYLDELRRVASDKLPFETADRILYQLDILLGNSIGEKT